MNDPLMIVIFIGVLYFGGIIHEIGHGLAALRCGDDTAKLMGRITLNPIAHFDPIMSFIVPIIMLIVVKIPFGGMKPVPVNPYNFDNFNDWKAFRRADIFVSIAGPAAQILFATVVLVIFLLLSPFITPNSYAFYLFFYGFLINIFIAFFNLIPIPPLDGSHVFKYLLATENRVVYEKLGRQFGFMFLIAFVVLGGVNILNPIFNVFLRLFIWTYSHISLSAILS